VHQIQEVPPCGPASGSEEKVIAVFHKGAFVEHMKLSTSVENAHTIVMVRRGSRLNVGARMSGLRPDRGFALAPEGGVYPTVAYQPLKEIAARA
jgi:hypothetical protein